MLIEFHPFPGVLGSKSGVMGATGFECIWTDSPQKAETLILKTAETHIIQTSSTGTPGFGKSFLDQKRFFLKPRHDFGDCIPETTVAVSTLADSNQFLKNLVG